MRHLFTVDRERRIMIASQWYLDRFVMIGGSWFFEERKLILDWSENQSVRTMDGTRLIRGHAMRRQPPGPRRAPTDESHRRQTRVVAVLALGALVPRPSPMSPTGASGGDTRCSPAWPGA